MNYEPKTDSLSWALCLSNSPPQPVPGAVPGGQKPGVLTFFGW